MKFSLFYFRGKDEEARQYVEKYERREYSPPPILFRVLKRKY